MTTIPSKTEFIAKNWSGENRWRRAELENFANELKLNLYVTDTNQDVFERILIEITKQNEKKENSTCNICAENFNKSSRALVKCICDFECCRSCFKIYLLSKTDDSSCMSCKIVFDRKFLTDNLDKSFMNKTYKLHREDVLIDRELGMLQATQSYVEKEIKIEKLNLQIKLLKDTYIKNLELLEDELYSVKYKNGELSERKKFIRKCPNGECHGFLSSSLKCELCECWACSDCREPKGYTTIDKDNHICDKNILENIKFMEKDSKPCPKCSSMISKVSGCSQMWCVECHTTFDWNTLKISTGPIHNPEYFAYQRNNGTLQRNPLDIQCGRELDHHFIQNLKLKHKTDPLFDVCRQVIHIRFVEQPRFHNENRLNENLQLRIDFMRNKIDKNTFKVNIQKKEKNILKKTEFSNVLAMYVTCMTDLFYRLNNESYNSIKTEMNVLRNYTNECLTRISSSYNCIHYIINDDFIFTKVKVINVQNTLTTLN